MVETIIKIIGEKSSRNCKSFHNLIRGDTEKKGTKWGDFRKDGLHNGEEASIIYHATFCAAGRAFAGEPTQTPLNFYNGVKETVNRKTLLAAFHTTIPVLMGYLAIGMAFGLMLQSVGYGVGWAFLMSLAIYAGSGQYLGVSLLAAGVPLAQTAFLTLMINFRHLVYGLSMLEKFRGMGKRKLYMIFSLTDETYALLSAAKAPEGVEEHDYYFAIALLDHSYWILGSVFGSVLGAALGFDTTGVDFAMTALFLVIAVGQWRSVGSHLPALLGAAATLVSLLAVGAEDMLLPALGVIVLVLTLMRPRLAQTDGKAEEREEKAV